MVVIKELSSAKISFDKCDFENCKSHIFKINGDDEIRKQKLNADVKTYTNIRKQEKLKMELLKIPKIIKYYLCKYNSCKNKFYNLLKITYKSFHYRVKLYNIKLTLYLKKLSDEHKTLYKKKNLSKNEIFRLIIINELLRDQIYKIEKYSKLQKLNEKYKKCSQEKCSELNKIISEDNKLYYAKLKMLSKDKIGRKVINELMKKLKIRIKKDELIEFVLLHPKQIALDKCITYKCNKKSFNLIKEGLKINIKKIELGKIIIPLYIKQDIDYLSSLKKLTKKDISKANIALIKITNYVDSKIKY